MEHMLLSMENALKNNAARETLLCTFLFLGLLLFVRGKTRQIIIVLQFACLSQNKGKNECKEQQNCNIKMKIK